MAFLFSTCRTNFDQRTNRNFMIVPIPRTFTLDTLQRLPPTSRGTISSQIFHAKYDILIRKKKRKILLKFEKEIFDLDERRRTTLRIGGDLSSIPPPPFTLLDNKGESKPRLLDQAFSFESNIFFRRLIRQRRWKNSWNLHPTPPSCLCAYAPFHRVGDPCFLSTFNATFETTLRKYRGSKKHTSLFYRVTLINRRTDRSLREIWARKRCDCCVGGEEKGKQEGDEKRIGGMKRSITTRDGELSCQGKCIRSRSIRV